MTTEKAKEILRRNKPTYDPRSCGSELCCAVELALEALDYQDFFRFKEPIELDGAIIHDCESYAIIWTVHGKRLYDIVAGDRLLEYAKHKGNTLLAWMPPPDFEEE